MLPPQVFVVVVIINIIPDASHFGFFYFMVIPFEQLDENQAWQTPVDQTGHHQNYGG